MPNSQLREALISFYVLLPRSTRSGLPLFRWLSGIEGLHASRSHEQKGHDFLKLCNGPLVIAPGFLAFFFPTHPNWPATIAAAVAGLCLFLGRICTSRPWQRPTSPSALPYSNQNRPRRPLLDPPVSRTNRLEAPDRRLPDCCRTRPSTVRA